MKPECKTIRDKLISRINSLPKRAFPDVLCSDRRERYSEEEEIDRLNSLRFDSTGFVFDVDIWDLLKFVPPEHFPFIFPYALRAELLLLPKTSDFFEGLIYGLAERKPFPLSKLRQLSNDELLVFEDFCALLANRVTNEGPDCGTKIDAFISSLALETVRRLRGT